MTSDFLQIRHHHFDDVLLADFVKGLLKPTSLRRNGRFPQPAGAGVEIRARTQCQNDDQAALRADQ